MNWQELIEVLKGHNVIIQTHNFPDPDAISSAFGMQKFLRFHNINSTICYNGKVDKVSVTRMVSNFNISIYEYEEIKLEDDNYILIVDSQNLNSNIAKIPGKVVACIDHHPTFKPYEYMYKDVRIVGSCASLVTEYFIDSNTPMDVETASALLYGLKMDTNSFRRGVTEFDIEMYGYLFKQADTALVDKMMNSSIELKDLSAYNAAIDNIILYGNVGIVRIPFECEDALVAMISDFILKIDSVTVSVVYAEKNGGLKFSVRSEEKGLHAGVMLSSALNGIGDGGGHAEMAGGFIPEEKRITKKLIDDFGESKIDSYDEDIEIYNRIVNSIKAVRKEYKAVVFDMDGVIFDSEKIYRKYEHEILSGYGIDKKTIDIFCNRVAGSTKPTGRKIFYEMFGYERIYDQYRMELLERVDKHYDTYGIELKPGVLDLLIFLKEKNIKVAIATSTIKERAQKHLEKSGVLNYVDQVVYGDMVKHGKPDPEIYMTACMLLGVPTFEAIGVEDSINGIKSSHLAGLDTVMVVDLIEPNDVAELMADNIYYTISEIKNKICEL